MVDAIIFDMDGTLLDTESIWNDSWTEAEKYFEFELPLGVKKSFIGMPKQQFIKIKDQVLPSFLNYDELQQFRQQFFTKRVESTPIGIKKGAFELLEYCTANRIKKIVCTSTYDEKAIPWLKETGLIDYFDDIITGNLVKIGKPSPDIYQLALMRNNLLPKNCIAIEDTSVGIQSATSANLSTYFIKDINDVSEEIRSLIEKEVLDLGEIIKEIGGSNNE